MKIRLIAVILLSMLIASCDKPESENTLDAKLITTTGEKIALNDLHGKSLIINFWASWCPPCKEEIPAFNDFAKKHEKDAIVLAYNFDGLEKPEIEKVMKKANIHYAALFDKPSEALHLDEPLGLPVTYVFNAKGQLTKTLYRPQTLKTLEKAIS